MNLPLWSHLEDVTYHTTQAQSILAVLPAHFPLFTSSLYPRCPSSFHTFLRPTHPPLLLGVDFLVLSMSWPAEHGERQSTDDPAHFPHLKVQILLRHIKAHSGMSKVKKKKRKRKVDYNIYSSSCKNLRWTCAKLQRDVKNEIPPVQQCKPLGGQLH